ncbi:MAG: sigma-70 family RNA polymerase sigma factor [Rhodothermales bacterium]|nr:sigma-70 family RNA polymerase sigma factor [Rhodothermales bacterium]
MNQASDITYLLQEISAGNPDKMDDLFPLVYDELKVLAHHRLNREFSGNTLATTGLVHEAYLKLVRKPENVDWQSRSHFYAVASRAMRQVLVNRAYARKAQKRGSEYDHIVADDSIAMTEERAGELIALHEALKTLRKSEPRVADVVDLRYFGGFTVSECADILKVSESTVNRDWRLARLWLYSWISEEL